MLWLGKSIIPSASLSPFLPCRSNGRQFGRARAKKPSIGENSQAKSPTFSLRISKAFLGRSAVAVFALGFLDAGYSGDWSRIGVITKETEELLKHLCAALWRQAFQCHRRRIL
uniref:Uncharacterized protein LOC105032246 isoform X2 n=1 Tax=Elaeis guineensis var. tenera TaxID=51953 RepID=A0A8N4EXK1_ELAGV|nr:uncharacterized protein LOC105032246 isoform X2 [Elaeis guineensis]